jgi:hypothetical protein
MAAATLRLRLIRCDVDHQREDPLQFALNGFACPLPPPDPAAGVVAQLRRTLTRGRRRDVRRRLREDRPSEPGRILDEIWSRATTDPRIVGALLVVCCGAGVALATLQR